MTRVSTFVTLAVFVGTVFAANWALATWGIIPIGFGLAAPAGVYFAGFALTARDYLRERAGLPVTLAAIGVGAALSWLLEDGGRIALASAIAFGFSELADSAVYEPLRKRGWATAVFASGTVGLVIDSALFLWIAFGSLHAIEGLIVGKLIVTLCTIGLLTVLRERRRGDLPFWRNYFPARSTGGLHGDLQDG